MPLPKKIYRGRVARGRMRAAAGIKALKEIVERKRGELSPFDLIKYSNVIQFLGLKGEKIKPKSITPAKTRAALGRLDNIYFKNIRLLVRDHYVLSFSEKKNRETEEQFRERKRLAWKEFQREKRSDKRFYHLLLNGMRENPTALENLHSVLVEKLVGAEKRTLSKMEKQGFKFDRQTGDYSARITEFNSDTMSRFGAEEAFRLWSDSVRRTHQAHKITMEGIAKQARDLDRLEFLLETLLFESRNFPAKEKELDAIRKKLEKRTPYFGFLLDVASTLRTQIMPLLEKRTN